MTRNEAKTLLNQTMLFNEGEESKIMQHLGNATMGHIIVACEVACLKLYGSDINVLLETATALNLS